MPGPSQHADASIHRDASDTNACGFPRSCRLTRQSEYARVFKHGQRRAGRYFICYWAGRDNGQHSRLGMAVSRKVGSATVRNRVKRYIREYFRTHRRFLPAPIDLVVVARPPSAALDYRQSTAALHRLLTEGGVQRG